MGWGGPGSRRGSQGPFAAERGLEGPWSRGGAVVFWGSSSDCGWGAGEWGSRVGGHTLPSAVTARRTGVSSLSVGDSEGNGTFMDFFPG